MVYLTYSFYIFSILLLVVIFGKCVEILIYIDI